MSKNEPPHRSPVIEFRGVTFAYEDQPPVLAAVDLRFEAGGFYVITGPSGSGKSTLLRLVSRLEEPQRGEIRFHHRPLREHDPPRLRRALLNIQQAPVVLEDTVRENLRMAFGLASNRDLRAPTDEQLRAQLRQVRLDDVALDDNARALSVGQQQRLCLVRGMLLDPEVMLLDEPTSALDDCSAEQVTAAIGRIYQARRLTVLMVSHRDHLAHLPAGVTPVPLRVEAGRVTLGAEGPPPAQSGGEESGGEESGGEESGGEESGGEESGGEESGGKESGGES
jgi:putative ABC transport system ATP-binding protein